MTHPEPSVRARAKNAARQLNRLRWLRKARIASRHEGNATGAQTLRYILADPELDTFSYAVSNAGQMATEAAPILGVDSSTVAGYFAEVEADPVLRERIRTAARADWSVKANPPLGRQLISYAAVRVLAPTLTLEIGVRHGLGTLTMLRALERNAAEGRGGELVSVDIDPYAGRLVPADAPNWTLVTGPSPDVLDAAVMNRRVGFMVSDSVPTPAVTRAEVSFALAHAASPLVILQSAWNSVLADISRDRGVDCRSITELPVAHVGAGRTSLLARFDSAGG